MKSSRAFLCLSLAILSVAVLAKPNVASAGLIDYTALMQVQSAGGSLGYLADDPNYVTPLLTSSVSGALEFEFTLNGTSGTQIDLAVESSSETAFPYFGLIEGRDNTSSDIASGSFNYLYMGNTNGTSPGATPQTPGMTMTLQAA